MFFQQNHVHLAVAKAGGATKVSNACGVSNSAVYKWIDGRRVPDIDQAKKLAELSGVSLENLRPVL